MEFSLRSIVAGATEGLVTALVPGISLVRLAADHPEAARTALRTATDVAFPQVALARNVVGFAEHNPELVRNVVTGAAQATALTMVPGLGFAAAAIAHPVESAQALGAAAQAARGVAELTIPGFGFFSRLFF